METIRIYLENMFANLPKDAALLRAKEDLLSMMEERYNDLKAEGKSENEAVGEVISRFGNIDELLEELGINTASKEQEADPDTLYPTEEETEKFLRHRRIFGWMTGLGVLMILIGVACVVALGSLLPAFTNFNENLCDSLSIFAMFFFICIGVTLFIVFGIGNEKYEKYEKQMVVLPENVRCTVEERYEKNRLPLALSISGGIILIILGVCVTIASDAIFGDVDMYNGCGAAIMLTCIGLGVMFMCHAGVENDGFKYLLNIEKNAKSGSSRETAAEQIFNAIFWPAVVVVYLVWSFVFGGWAISWIVFPVGGIITGIVSTVCKAVSEDRK